MDLSATRERVQALQEEIAKLRASNQQFLTERLHSSLQLAAHKQRELRLQQLVEELARLGKTKLR